MDDTSIPSPAADLTSSPVLAEADLAAFATHYMQCDEEDRKRLFNMLISMSSNLY
jgi:hypothetical protein